MSSVVLPGTVEGSDAEVLDIVFSSNNGEQLCIVHGQENWPTIEWTPIGIVVVPGTHNRYGDGTCGIMSLVGMSRATPETGIAVTDASQTDNVSMYWGHYSALVDNDIFTSTTALTSSLNYIPYQSASGSTDCTAHIGALVWPYGGTTTAPTSAASTSYSNSGTYPYVSATSEMAGCDFNGIRNTVACYVKTRTASQWTASIVDNGTGTTNTTAAACCGRFKTVGTNSFLDVFSGITSNSLNYGTPDSTKTNKGFWYFPALGELTYLPSKRFQINDTITALNQKYGNIGVQLDTSASYWSSSEGGVNNAWNMYTYNGLVNYRNKGYNDRVRAFMRL